MVEGADGEPTERVRQREEGKGATSSRVGMRREVCVGRAEMVLATVVRCGWTAAKEEDEDALRSERLTSERSVRRLLPLSALLCSALALAHTVHTPHPSSPPPTPRRWTSAAHSTPSQRRLVRLGSATAVLLPSVMAGDRVYPYPKSVTATTRLLLPITPPPTWTSLSSPAPRLTSCRPPLSRVLLSVCQVGVDDDRWLVV